MSKKSPTQNGVRSQQPLTGWQPARPCIEVVAPPGDDQQPGIEETASRASKNPQVLQLVDGGTHASTLRPHPLPPASMVRSRATCTVCISQHSRCSLHLSRPVETADEDAKCAGLEGSAECQGEPEPKDPASMCNTQASSHQFAEFCGPLEWCVPFESSFYFMHTVARAVRME